MSENDPLKDGRAKICPHCHTWMWRDAVGVYRHGKRRGMRCNYERTMARERAKRLTTGKP